MDESSAVLRKYDKKRRPWYNRYDNLYKPRHTESDMLFFRYHIF